MTNNMLSGHFSYSALIKFSFPTIVMMVFMATYSMVDGIFVSRLVGTNALSAVNIVYPLVGVVIAVSIMLATGGSAIVARKMGEGNSKEAKQDFTFIILVGVVLGFAIMIFALLFLEPLLYFLGANSVIYDYCYDYAYWLVWFTIPAVLQMLFQILFVTAGKPGIGLAITVLGGVANIVLDYVFIAIFNWGITGAAIATVIGYSIPAVFGLVWFSACRKGTLYFVRPVWRAKVLLHTIINGSSEMVTNLAASIITYLFNIIMMRLIGEDGVAAITIVLYAEFLLTAVYLGYSSGIAPILSYNHGEGNHFQLKRLFLISIRFLLCCSAITFAGAMVFAPNIVSVFAPKGSLVFSLALHGFYIYSISFLFMGINIYASSLFTALSDGKTSAFLSFMRTLVFIVLGLTILPRFFEVNGVWIAVPIAELLSIFLSIFCFRWQYFKKWKEDALPAHAPEPEKQL